VYKLQFFYRVMHYSAKHGLAITCRLSIHLSVCLSVMTALSSTETKHLMYSP